MSGNRLLVTLALLALVPCLGPGCGGSDEKVLAVVGDYEITDKEFNEFYRINYAFPTAEDEFTARMMVLDSAIMTRLLVEAAYEKGIDKLEELARVVLANKNKFLIDVLLQRQVTDEAQPTEAELKDFYNHLEHKVRASHILLDNLDTAQMVLERIKNGENFEKLAYEYSKDQDAKRNKGDLGYFTWGTMVDEFQEAVFVMEPGEVSPPVETQFGYHIIKVVDKLPNERRTDYKSMKRQLTEMVQRYKTSRIGERYFNDIMSRYSVTIDTATCNYLLHKRESIYPPMLLETLPRNDFDPEQLDRNERELVLATWDGGQMTVIEYLTQANRHIPPATRPDLDDYDSLASVIFRLKISDILAVEAHRQGIDNDPEFLRKLRLFKELAMAEIMKDDSLPLPPPPEEEEVRRYYDEHQDLFTIPAKVHMYEIMLSDELKAQKLKKELNSLEEFKQAATKMTERSGKRIGGGDLGYVEQRWMPDIFAEAWKTPVGEIAGPIQNKDGKYVLIYVVDKIEAQLKDYLGLKREIIQRLRNQQKKEALDRWVEDRKTDVSVVINEDALWSTIDKDKYVADEQTATP